MKTFDDNYTGNIYADIEAQRAALVAAAQGKAAPAGRTPAPKRFSASYVEGVYAQLNAGEAAAAQQHR